MLYVLGLLVVLGLVGYHYRGKLLGLFGKAVAKQGEKIVAEGVKQDAEDKK